MELRRDLRRYVDSTRGNPLPSPCWRRSFDLRPSSILLSFVFSFVPLQTRIRLSYAVRALFPSPVANRFEFDTAQRHRSIREINIHGTKVKNRWFGADRRKTVAPQDLVSPSLEMSTSLCPAFRILILRLVNFYRERRMLLSLSFSLYLFFFYEGRYVGRHVSLRHRFFPPFARFSLSTG